ncbi:hypothetical protein IV454_04790 [Massilia antarctica]|uniref:Uncharacterized protein n=1 Tax=Massilia antarctica TaxID=2765360 RepID=A0AA48WF83_9BURK|nr:hypothetical protein [Massilia antarctica]QPI50886.1 hypothetical protein IV454_04790 [Massilia antarctica]
MGVLVSDLKESIRESFRRLAIFVKSHRLGVLSLMTLALLIAGAVVDGGPAKLFSEVFKYTAGALLAAFAVVFWEFVSDYAELSADDFWLESDQTTIKLHFEQASPDALVELKVHVERKFNMLTKNVGELKFKRSCKGSWKDDSYLKKIVKTRPGQGTHVDLTINDSNISGTVQLDGTRNEYLQGCLLSTEVLRCDTCHYALSIGSRVDSAKISWAVEGKAPAQVHAYLYGEVLKTTHGSSTGCRTPIRMTANVQQQVFNAEMGYDLLIFWNGEEP